ncbi:hypothetical protein ACIQTN_25890 [Streptomyces werraensis]|uniref:hypothetical protein n=1 Tax=Streptomyces werraensis TaxID=68284 RepID=UPI00381C51A5
MTSTTAHLTTVIRHWTDLHDALGAPALHNGFGIGLRGHLAALTDIADRALTHAAERADSASDAPGERPAPLRPMILDTMTEVETALVDCADQLAAEIQRTPMSRAPRDWPAADRARRNQLADQDANDPRRWKWTGKRTAPYAALWLYARITQPGGPFAPLTDRHRETVAAVARSCAVRVERALDIAAQVRTLEQPCACGGRIDVHGGEGRQPLAHCTGCGRIWTEGGVIAA